jgi:two-component system phosphate regulon sensor histidine kinase PhoR
MISVRKNISLESLANVMKPKRILWRIFPAFLCLAIIVLATITWYATEYFEEVALTQSRETLHQEARIIETLIQPQLHKKDYIAIDQTLKALGNNAKSRFTVILPNGQVIADSSAPIASLENHSDREEILVVLNGTASIGITQRYSRTQRIRALYVAIPVLDQHHPIAVIRASISMDSIHNAIKQFYIQIIIACGLILVVVSLICYILYRWLTTPLEQLREGIDRFTTGNLNHRLAIPSGDSEISDITRAINDMASQLNERFESLQHEQHEKETILTSLFDGILVVDCNETILNLNQVAASVLDISISTGAGQKLASQVRNSALIDLVRSTIREKSPATREIVFRSHQEEFYQVDCIPIRESTFSIRKILVVFHNITQSKRIQGTRRDVIMKVSQQLKLPITRILDLAHDLPEIHEQSKLLITIINDLMYLTEFENLVETQTLEIHPVNLRTIFQDALNIRHAIAEQKGIEVEIHGNGDLIGHADSILQMALRLLTNSLTYTPAGGQITIELATTPQETCITIRDTGIGIPEDTIRDIFKPFYRIKTPEHQQVHGGGLGLAIVKAVVDAHRGKISVESPNQTGAQFCITIPKSTQGGHHVLST